MTDELQAILIKSVSICFDCKKPVQTDAKTRIEEDICRCLTHENGF